MSLLDPSPRPDTYFAPAGRLETTLLQQQVSSCLKHPMVHLVLELVDSYVVVLNEQRQVLVANSELQEALSAETPASYQGLRPGEILGCSHVSEGPDGCGTSQACCRCGAVLAILAAQTLEEPVSRECYLDRYDCGMWRPGDFRVKATPFRLGKEPFTVAVFQDIGSEKRARQLESLFLHDLQNTVHGLHGWSELLSLGDQDPHHAAGHIRMLSEALSEEVQQQQMLLRAESRELVSQEEIVPVGQVLGRLEKTLERHPATLDHGLEIQPAPVWDELKVDPVVLHRVLLNMAINALEATPPGEGIQVWFERRGQRPCFFVQNPGVIPEMVRPRIFQRSFSTKGRRGRGLGTYSMKYLGENILGGEVGFQSSREEGTCFHLFLPRRDS